MSLIQNQEMLLSLKILFSCLTYTTKHTSKTKKPNLLWVYQLSMTKFSNLREVANIAKPHTFRRELKPMLYIKLIKLKTAINIDCDHRHFVNDKKTLLLELYIIWITVGAYSIKELSKIWKNTINSIQWHIDFICYKVNCEQRFHAVWWIQTVSTIQHTTNSDHWFHTKLCSDGIVNSIWQIVDSIQMNVKSICDSINLTNINRVLIPSIIPLSSKALMPIQLLLPKQSVIVPLLSILITPTLHNPYGYSAMRSKKSKRIPQYTGYNSRTLPLVPMAPQAPAPPLVLVPA